MEFTHTSDGLTEADDQMDRLEFGVWWMSRQAIAAVLARTDVASGERLVALSLASFAGRENRAWPGRAGRVGTSGTEQKSLSAGARTVGRTRAPGCRRAGHRAWPI